VNSIPQYPADDTTVVDWSETKDRSTPTLLLLINNFGSLCHLSDLHGGLVQWRLRFDPPVCAIYVRQYGTRIMEKCTIRSRVQL
jgi:hypothetical protein